MAWQLLNQTYREAGIVPVLGAGVSRDSHLPNWYELLQRVEQIIAPSGESQLVASLRHQGFSLPAIAGMLRALSPEGQVFAEIVREELYRTFPQELRRSDDLGGLVKFVQATNLTLKAVAALCVIPTGSEPPFRKNPLIHAIVNFNMDPVLRQYVQGRYGFAFVRSVERPSKARDPEKISLYYMHGFLRFDKKAGNRNKEAADKLVLAEHEYFDFFNNPTGIFNHTFLYLLREYSCLFVGLSMQDDNIRRLLHYSTKERVQAYKEEGNSAKKAQSRAIRHFAVLKEYESKALNTAIELSLKQLGTHTLWVSKHNEIPDRFREMYGAQEWNSVY